MNDEFESCDIYPLDSALNNRYDNQMAPKLFCVKTDEGKYAKVSVDFVGERFMMKLRYYTQKDGSTNLKID